MIITDEFFDALSPDGTIFPSADDLFHYAKELRSRLSPAESPKQAGSVGVDTTLSKLIDILGWQGGTIHDALSEVLTLVKFHENHHPTCKQSLQVDTANVLVERLKWYIDELANCLERTGRHCADMKDADEYLANCQGKSVDEIVKKCIQAIEESQQPQTTPWDCVDAIKRKFAHLNTTQSAPVNQGQTLGQIRESQEQRFVELREAITQSAPSVGGVPSVLELEQVILPIWYGDSKGKPYDISNAIHALLTSRTEGK